MAKRKINKSQAIRDYLATSPDASPKLAVSDLAKKRVKVTEAQVSSIKWKLKKDKNNGKVVRNKSTRSFKSRSAFGSTPLPIEVLVEAKKLRQLAGSEESAVAAIQAVSAIENA